MELIVWLGGRTSWYNVTCTVHHTPNKTFLEWSCHFDVSTDDFTSPKHVPFMVYITICNLFLLACHKTSQECLVVCTGETKETQIAIYRSHWCTVSSYDTQQFNNFDESKRFTPSAHCWKRFDCYLVNMKLSAHSCGFLWLHQKPLLHSRCTILVWTWEHFTPSLKLRIILRHIIRQLHPV